MVPAMSARPATRRRVPLRGIVTAIVAVTGVEDEVKDIIVPGAFATTLAKRRPKVCYMHDWHKPIGRVLSIAELKPGDKKLPKTLPDGRPFPKEGGAVIAVMQFHIGTQAGRDAFEHCRQWAINGEAAFSIGFNVPDGMSSKTPAGVRLIYGLELFEVSLVLHGAHTMALALEVKSALDMPSIETKDAAVQTMEVPDTSIMVALYPDEHVAEEVRVEDGLAADQLHITLALPGDADLSAVVEAVTRVAADHDPLAGNIGGIGIFPPSKGSESGIPIFRTVDVPGLVEVRQAILAALASAGYQHQSEHGFTPHMTIGYDLPRVAPIENVPAKFRAITVMRGNTERIDVPLGEKKMPATAGKAALAVIEARLVNAYVTGDSAGAALLEAKALNAATVTVPTLGTARKTPLRQRRTRPGRPQEVITA